MALRLLLLLLIVSLCSAQCPTGCSCIGRTSITCTGLTSFPTLAFPDVTALRLNNINSNIPPNAFAAMPRLQSISITNGNISSIARCAFSGIPTKSISISRVRIGNIASGAFQNLQNVARTISITYGQIDLISSHAFYRLSNLATLSIQRNNITTIQGYAFSRISSSRAFYFYYNNVTNLNDYAFASLNRTSFSSTSYFFQGSIMNVGCKALEGLKSVSYVTLRCDCDMVPLIQSSTSLGFVHCFSRSQLHDVISGSGDNCTVPSIPEPNSCTA
ncbi:leucine-rich repeat and immunoglobulin-like domain-containing nogo receptor-interacting protein 1-B [Haliotis asinina]|uniref:leucine-rich repeat and immunoglobulin-like domain-containing nogo receptor-interacting protein 1-B n=1 Tax=Haliotis asinina TaxID=109174 RepID=UPI003531C45C